MFIEYSSHYRSLPLQSAHNSHTKQNDHSSTTSRRLSHPSLVCIRRIERLNFVNTIANVLIGFCLVVIVFYAGDRLVEKGVDPRVVAVCPSSLYLFVGTAVFAFEGAASLTLPVANSVRPQEQQGFLAMYLRTCFCIVLFYATYGMVAYLSYGPGSPSSHPSLCLITPGREPPCACSIQRLWC